METDELVGKQFLQTIGGRAARFVGALLLSLTFMAGTLASTTAIAQQSCPTPGYGLDDAVCTDPTLSDWAYDNGSGISFKTVEELIPTLPPAMGPCTLDPTSLGPFHLVTYYGGNPTYASVAAWIGGALGFIDRLEMADINYQCPSNHVPSYIRYTIERTRGISCPAGFNENNAYFIVCWSRQKALTITLSGGTEVEPTNGSEKKFLPIIATVKDQNKQPPTTSVTVRISLKVDPTSGGHAHGDSTRPRGGIADVKTCASDSECWSGTTDGNGQAVFNFNPTETSGTHTISATCDGCTNTATKPVDVKVAGLEIIPEIPFLYTIKLPNRDTNHPATYFLTKASAEKLITIALYYYAFTFAKKKQGIVPDFVLNDASLEWGGVLDCFLTCNSAQYPSTPWHKHHVEHRRGSVVDIKANGAPGSIVYADVFKRFAKKYHVTVGSLHGSGSGLHYHIRLNNNKPE